MESDACFPNHPLELRARILDFRASTGHFRAQERMKRRRILIICLCLLCTGVAAWFWLVSHEPTYRGERLSYWLSTYDVTRSHRPDRVDAERTIREIGSNAVPTLLKMLKVRPSHLRLILQAVLEKLPIPTDRFTTAESLRYRASRAFVVLGPEAKSAVPSLVADLSEPDADVRLTALKGIQSIHSEPALALPALVKLLQSTNANDCNGAASAITAYGVDARPLTPELVAMVRKSPPLIALLVQAAAPIQFPNVPVSSQATNSVSARSVAALPSGEERIIMGPPSVMRTGDSASEAWNLLNSIDPDAGRKLREEFQNKH
jgi:hypothetical protein